MSTVTGVHKMPGSQFLSTTIEIFKPEDIPKNDGSQNRPCHQKTIHSYEWFSKTSLSIPVSWGLLPGQFKTGQSKEQFSERALLLRHRSYLRMVLQTSHLFHDKVKDKMLLNRGPERVREVSHWRFKSALFTPNNDRSLSRLLIAFLIISSYSVGIMPKNQTT